MATIPFAQHAVIVGLPFENVEKSNYVTTHMPSPFQSFKCKITLIIPISVCSVLGITQCDDVLLMSSILINESTRDCLDIIEHK